MEQSWSNCPVFVLIARFCAGAEGERLPSTRAGREVTGFPPSWN